MKYIRLFFKTILIALAVFLVTLGFIADCIGTGLISGIRWTFGRTNYWNLGNEWFQYKQEITEWYGLWKGQYGDY